MRRRSNAGKVPDQVLQQLMRRIVISTTMNYYANVEAAEEEAVMGPGRDSPRNGEGPVGPGQGGADGASGCESTTGGDATEMGP
jgi:hypothetical protein